MESIFLKQMFNINKLCQTSLNSLGRRFRFCKEFFLKLKRKYKIFSLGNMQLIKKELKFMLKPEKQYCQKVGKVNNLFAKKLI